MSDVSRLLRPKSIAVVGGGAWCAQIVLQCQQMGFSGDIWVVHPKGMEVHGIRAVPSLDDLPGCPDAVFLGVNRFLTIDLVAQLAGMGAGGAVCFASGFSEALAEDEAGADLQARLVEAAGAMPILGPNCYGFINAVDQALLWPDQHGCVPVDRGVAVLTQSSNIAINLTMQQRALPIAYMVACGNMAQTSQAQIAMALLDDPRVTVIGLHIEGFGDTAEWHALALKAASKGIPLLALKVGKSEQAQSATVSHTASLAGSDAGADALLRRFGIGRVHDVPTFLETLKLLHVAGPLDAPTLSSISCSGGEASLAADTAHGTSLSFPALQDAQKQALRNALGPMVALSNPLDYNTYVWRDTDAMTAAWLPMAADHIGLTLLIVDYPHTDATDWVCATDAAIAVRETSGRPVAVVATLPELMPQDVAAQLMAAGVVPMNGLTEAIAAAQVAAALTDIVHEAPLPAGVDRDGALLSERDAKTMLQSYGVSVPQVFDAAIGPEEHSGPFVVKGVGFAHKSEMDAVRLNVAKADLDAVAADMPGDDVLVEAMITGAVAELLVGVVRDSAHGFVLTVGAGGVMTEILQDTQSLLIPSDAGTVKTALSRLKTFPLLTGFRGKPTADLDAIVAAIMGVQAFVVARHDRIEEVEINPLMCTPRAAIAADALIRIAPERT
ncbi:MULTISPECIES: acetate--CoA ligase family protein [Rhodobacterales]|uniref:acetate--CoA ligase family protein n=1 Tax=Ascidiaceihabitans sp. TaxID=1872644 RepID=UPI003296ED33